MDDRIDTLFKKYSDELFDYGNKTEEQVKAVEDQLGVIFNQEYREYIKAYGSGGAFVDICGIENDDYKSVVNHTLSYREFGLPDNMYVVSHIDEFGYCMYSSETENEKVFSFSKHDQNGLLERYDCFTDYVLERVQDGIDNL